MRIVSDVSPTRKESFATFAETSAALQGLLANGTTSYREVSKSLPRMMTISVLRSYFAPFRVGVKTPTPLRRYKMPEDKVVVIFFNKGDYHVEHYDAPGEARQAVKDAYANRRMGMAVAVKGQLLWHARIEDNLIFDKEH